MASAGKSVTGFGAATSAMGAVATVAIAGAAAASVKAALDFDESFTRIAAISNTSASALEGMKSEVIDLAGETAQAPTELADALFFLSSAGLDAAEVMPALEASAKASAVGLGETADVANIVASALNAYAGSGLTAAQATDVLVAAVREGRAEPEEFASALGRILPIASTVGVSFDQVAASMAALSNIGLDVNEGVTAMRGVLQAIAAPGSQAAEAMDELGLSAQELLDAISEDGILGALRLLDEAARKQTDTQAEYNNMLRQVVPNVRSLTGVLGLTVQEADKVDGVFQRVLESEGALSKAFRTTAESDAFKFKQGLNDLLIAGQELATQVLPQLADALGAVADVVAFAGDELSGFLGILIGVKVGLGSLAPVAAVGTGGFQELTLAQGEQISGMELGVEAYGDFREAVALTEPQLLAVVAALEAGNPALLAIESSASEAINAFLGLGRRTDEAASATEGVVGGIAAFLGVAPPAADAANDLARGHQNAANAAREQRIQELALAGGLLGVVASANDLQDAQAEVNRLQEKGKRGTEEYRQAVANVLTTSLGLKQGLLDLGAEMLENGRSGDQVVRRLMRIGVEAGLTKGDVRDLLADVQGLTGDLKDLGKQHAKPKVSVQGTQDAINTVEQLESVLEDLGHREFTASVHVITTGGSTGFHLIAELEKALRHVTEQDWRAVITVVSDPTQDQLRAYLRDFAALERQIARVDDRMKDFRDSIRSGFDDIADLTGGMINLLDEFAQAQTDFADAQLKFAEDTVAFDKALAEWQAGGMEGAAPTAPEAPVAPVAPDLGAFLAQQIAASKAFANALKDLQKAGLSTANLQEVAASGSIELAQALLSDPTLIAGMNEAQKAISDVIGNTADKLTQAAFGEKVERLAREFNELSDALRQFVKGIPVPELKEETKEFINSLKRLNAALENIGVNIPGGGGNNGPGGGGGKQEENQALAQAIVAEMNRSLDPKVVPVAGFEQGVVKVLGKLGLLKGSL